MVTYPSTHGVFEEDDQGDLRDRPRARRPGLHGRRQHERAGRPLPARRHRRRRLPPQPAQDLLHPARRRRPGHGPDRRRGAPGAVPAAAPGRRDRRRATAIGAVSAAPWGSASILLISWAYIRMMGGDGLTAGDRRSRSSTPTTSPSGSTRTTRSSTAARTGCVAHECILDMRHFKKTRRHRGRGRRQAPDGLRLPRADDVVPGRRHADGRADRERVQGRARSLLRRDDRDPRRDRARSRTAARPREDNLLKNAPHTADAVLADEWNRALLAREGGVPAAVAARATSSGRRSPHQQRARRPQAGLHLPADRELRRRRRRRRPGQRNANGCDHGDRSPSAASRRSTAPSLLFTQSRT